MVSKTAFPVLPIVHYPDIARRSNGEIGHTLHFLRPVTCSDCSFSYGLPFTFYRNSSNASGEGLVLHGLLADAATVVAIALLLGAFWQHLATKRS
jgi:hypothetical protein